MNIKPGLYRTGPIDVKVVQRQAEQAGYVSFVLPNQGIVDRSTFFDAVRETLPLDPPVISSRSWDALADSLWEGLYTHSSPRIAVIWPGAKAMANQAHSDFEIALSVFSDIASTLTDVKVTCNNVKHVAFLVE